MEYAHDQEAYCCEWTIRWRFPMEGFVRDGESMGVGRFVGVIGMDMVAQLWFVDSGIKVEHSPGYAVQVDTRDKVIIVLRNAE